MLAANNRLNPRTYDADPTARALIDVVPYGLPAELLRAERPVLCGAPPDKGRKDRVLLWGGGLWDWFDPLTLLRALARVVAVRPGRGGSSSSARATPTWCCPRWRCRAARQRWPRR